MKFVWVSLPRDEGKLSEFLGMDDILIYSKHFYPTDQEHLSGIIFYDLLVDVDERKVDMESGRLADLILRAKGVIDDPGYRELKNANQRSIWLLAKYGISGADATTVQELLKPEMSAIIQEGGPA